VSHVAARAARCFPTPKTGRAGRQAVAKVGIRAVILLALATALTMTGTPVVPILAFYGLFFLLVLRGLDGMDEGEAERA
jgi:hypothetical protein